MPGLRIIGSGHYLPGRPYTNDDLARVMDTSDDWVRRRTGIGQRYFCPQGQGAADLALPAAERALLDANCEPQDIDYVIFNTMTPDHLFPGSAPILASKLGCGDVPAIDLRAQCAAMLFSIQMAESLLVAGAARRILIVGAEAHAAFMPWRDWDVLEGSTQRKPSPEDWERANRHRSWAVIFGDGAGALVVERDEDGAGLLSMDIHSDGRYAHQLCIPAGFRSRFYLPDEDALEHFTPVMEGREIFKHAVVKLPKSMRAACAAADVQLSDVDWFIAHQANDRINDAIASKLNLPSEKMPSNIERVGNTSSATVPILVDEMRRDGRLQPGQLVCLVALGAGIHWGSGILRT